MKLRDSLSQYWQCIQKNLFPVLEEELGPLSPKMLDVVTIFDLVRVESHVYRYTRGSVGRPENDRCSLARAFVAKAVLNLSTTRMLLDRLDVDAPLRRICGWERKGDIPSEATFSRAFAEFAEEGLPAKVHEALIRETHAERLVGHISRDSTAIEAREKPKRKCKPETQEHATPRKRGRPKNGEPRPTPVLTRLERQPTMNLPEMLRDLPTTCDVGCKRNSQGHQESWIGYKLHIDTADGDIPISAVLTSASLHDSQVAIPLATMTAERIDSCYDLMDAAYDAKEVAAHSRSLGHVPIIDVNPRGNALRAAIEVEMKARTTLGFAFPEDVRFRERSAAERVNSALKDTFGGRFVRVRGHSKVFCHLMFGLLALTAGQILRLAAP